MTLSPEEKKRFGEYLETRLVEIENSIAPPSREGGHEAFADQALRNAYKVEAIEDLRAEFQMDIQSTQNEE